MVDESPSDPHAPRDEIDRLAGIESQLSVLTERLAGGPRPDDPHSNERYGKSLYWLVSHLSDGVHILNNFMQVLIARIESVGANLDRNERTNQETLKATADLNVIARNLVATAKNIERQIGAAIPDHPVLMRELWWRLETDAVEVGLMLFTLVDCVIFLIGSGALVNSLVFQRLSGINGNPQVWGLIFAMILVFYVLAYFSRRRNPRRFAAFLCTVLYGGIGVLTITAPSGIALGPAHHLLASAGAAWILSRGPSNVS